MSAANDNGMPVAEWSHIELSAGTITDATIETSEGVRALLDEVGQFQFFIEAVDADSWRLGLGSCADYVTAIRLAEEARLDFEIDFPVRDNVVGPH